jgi:hypothetical protein
VIVPSPKVDLTTLFVSLGGWAITLRSPVLGAQRTKQRGGEAAGYANGRKNGTGPARERPAAPDANGRRRVTAGHTNGRERTRSRPFQYE